MFGACCVFVSPLCWETRKKKAHLWLWLRSHCVPPSAVTRWLNVAPCSPHENTFHWQHVPSQQPNSNMRCHAKCSSSRNNFIWGGTYSWPVSLPHLACCLFSQTKESRLFTNTTMWRCFLILKKGQGSRLLNRLIEKVLPALVHFQRMVGVIVMWVTHSSFC